MWHRCLNQAGESLLPRPNISMTLALEVWLRPELPWAWNPISYAILRDTEVWHIPGQTYHPDPTFPIPVGKEVWLKARAIWHSGSNISHGPVWHKCATRLSKLFSPRPIFTLTFLWHRSPDVSQNHHIFPPPSTIVHRILTKQYSQFLLLEPTITMSTSY